MDVNVDRDEGEVGDEPDKPEDDAGEPIEETEGDVSMAHENTEEPDTTEQHSMR